MEFKIEKRKGHILIIKLDGRLIGEFQIIQLNDQITEMIENKYYRIIFDFSQLEYINSSGLNFLLKILTKVRRSDGEIVLCALNQTLLNLLVTTKLNSFFTVTSTINDALDHFEKEKTSL